MDTEQDANEDRDLIPKSTRDVIDEAVWMALKNMKEPGHAIVHRALGLVRSELIAVVGHGGAAQLLRGLAAQIERESD